MKESTAWYPAVATGRSLAVIYSEYSYLRQLIAEAECGRAFENGDSHALVQFIRLLNSEPQIAKQMGMAGRKYLQSDVTPQIIPQQYLNVCKTFYFRK